ncbi:MAG: hypothetical protein IMZ44_07215, partial [Planctomycetes bacterium]|nr:hypothetical protein [Planctomycetota bacterium]
PVESGDGWNPDEFILHGGATLTSSNAALVLGYVEPASSTNFLAYPTIKGTGSNTPLVTLGGDINFRSGIKVDTGSTEAGLADINVASGNVQFTRDLTTGVGGMGVGNDAPTMDMIRTLSVQGGQAGIYNTHTQTATTTIAAGAKLVFDPNASITYAGSILNNGKILASTGTTDLGTTVITSSAPQYQYASGLNAGRLSGGFNTTGDNPNQDFEPDLSKMNYSGSAPYTGQPTSVTYPSGIWADNMTWVYSGQWHQNATGLVSFSENFDDSVMLKIDLNGDGVFGTGETLLNNGTWDSPTSSAGTMLAEGWYNFEVRYGQGSGGAGPVNQAGQDYMQGGGMALGWDSQGRGTVTYADHQNIPSADFRVLQDEGSLYVTSGATVLAAGLDNLGMVQVGGTLTLAGPGTASAKAFSIGGSATMTSLTGTGTSSELTVGGTLDVSGAATANTISISGTANVDTLTGNGTNPTTTVSSTGKLYVNNAVGTGLSAMSSLTVVGLVDSKAQVSADNTLVGSTGFGTGVAGSVKAAAASSGVNLAIENGSADYGANALALTGALTIGNAYVAPSYGYLPGLLEGKVSGNGNVTDPNPSTQENPEAVRLGTAMAFTSSKPPWADNETWVYTGQFQASATETLLVTFEGYIDDSAYVYFPDTDEVVIATTGNNFVNGTIALDAGWHNVEIRVGNGTGGAGQTHGAPGVGYDLQGRGSTVMTDYVATQDPGNGSVFRVYSITDMGEDAESGTLTAGDTSANVLTLINGSASVAK